MAVTDQMGQLDAVILKNQHLKPPMMVRLQTRWSPLNYANQTLQPSRVHLLAAGIGQSALRDASKPHWPRYWPMLTKKH